MSEEQMQVIPTRVGRFFYYPTRETNLDQLRKAKIISERVEKSLKRKRHDGVIVVPNGAVMAAIEYKQPKSLKTSADIKKTIKQAVAAAKAICKVLIITDNSKTFWVNTENSEFICDANGHQINDVIDVRQFLDGTITAESISRLETLLDQIESSISAVNNKVSAAKLLDPSSLAKSLWQRIWITTGKEPEKCLYNVVELFVFKFLSDLGVLKGHLNFSAVLKTRLESGAEDALTQYAGISRSEIRNLFPAGDDGTTLINGTIFVNDSGAANMAQATLFGEVLDLLDKYGREFGSFRYIQRDFKTRLYESFLRQSAGVKALGQYFTPRNVVRAMVQMSSADSLANDARICDPYCGVGGFLLETIVEVPKIFQQFEPVNGKVNPSITLLGYDKGSDEKDDERTIILAKANMLIYFSDLIATHHTPAVLKEFSDNAFNKVFRLLRSNLGTFAQNDDKPFDLILTNPPYVTSGVSTIRRAIEEAGLGKHYTCAGRGTEALAIEWIVRNLADGGQALVVVPDGLLSQKGVLKFIMEKCILQAVISLPSRTFYSTPKKTYILVLKKKIKSDINQTSPVFAYIASEIGESRDSYRFPTDENDLTEAVSLFNQFKGSPATFNPISDRCKVIAASAFLNESNKNWLVDRLWTDAEKKKLGFVENIIEITGEDFISIAKDIQDSLKQIESSVPNVSSKVVNVKTISLGEPWMEYVNTKTGWNMTEYRKLETKADDGCPVFSAANAPVAFVKPTHTGKIEASPKKPVLSFAANGDGSAGTNFELHISPFYVSTDRTCIRVKDANIDPEYILYSLHGMKEAYGYSHSFKATKENLSGVTINIPLKGKKFDLKLQQKIVSQFKTIYEAKRALEQQVKSLAKSRIYFGV